MDLCYAVKTSEEADGDFGLPIEKYAQKEYVFLNNLAIFYFQCQREFFGRIKWVLQKDRNIRDVVFAS
jgi:hypothetical protein